MKFKRILSNFSYAFISNGLNLLVSVVVALIVPKILGVKEYSYWQLYSFYSSYVGFFHFGWADGIYLKFGGKSYEELDKQYFATQFWLLVVMELFITLGIGFFAWNFGEDYHKSFVITMTGICCLVKLPCTMLQYLLQTTNRIGAFAKNCMLERLIYGLIVIGTLMAGVHRYEVLLGADLIAKVCTLLQLCYSCKDIVGKGIKNVIQGIREAWENICVGSRLMFANIAGLLLTGIVRFAIEAKWDVEAFGKVSLTMTVSNLMMVFIGAVSIVIYPVLRNTPKEKLSEIYSLLRSMLMIPLLGLLMVYYPAKELLSAWLPQYADSLRYMALLFPMCIFESKMTMLINTYLKTLRRERIILAVNWIAVGLTLILTALTVYVWESLTLAVVSLTLLLGIRSMMAELALCRCLKIHGMKDMIMEFLLALIFVTVSWSVQSWWCMVLYGACFFVYVMLHLDELKGMAGQIRSYMSD